MPFSGFDFMHLLGQMHTEHRALAPEAASRVYAMFGAKGGVGTTTLAYNIGAALVSTGADRRIDGRQPPVRRPARPAARARGDRLDRPTCPPTGSSGRIFRKSCTATSRAWKCSSRRRASRWPRWSRVRDMERLISLMRKVYNVVIIDTATTVDDTLLAYFDACDEIIQVVTYEWPSLQRARAMTETLNAINYSASRVRYLGQSCGFQGRHVARRCRSSCSAASPSSRSSAMASWCWTRTIAASRSSTWAQSSRSVPMSSRLPRPWRGRSPRSTTPLPTRLPVASREAQQSITQ